MDTPSKRVDIIPAKRHAMILDWLRNHSTASIQDLMNDIPASASTIRRDLDYLTQEGYVQRTHGGATLRPETPSTFEMESSIISHIAHPQKEAIGRAAAEIVKPRDSILLDSSTTVLEAVKELLARRIPFTAITNGLEIALLCSKATDVRVMVLGGSIRAGSPTLVGDPGLDFLRTIHADFCLIGTHAISGTQLTEASPDVAYLKRAMIRASRRTILLADSSKFRSPSLVTFAELSEMAQVITDDGVSDEQLASVRASVPNVVVAKQLAEYENSRSE
jgi:DeoR/GlpR family transcriptional regulator of sugar metabolism